MIGDTYETPCLDKGFVRLVDYMGDDNAICDAARVSYGNGTKSVSDNRSLIRYLMKNKHTSPFEHCIFKFHIKLPIFVARQMIRHRTASVNEVSGRYSEMECAYYVPDEENIRTQSKDNKQGRSAEILDNAGILAYEMELEQYERHRFYKDRLEIGMAKELARINLPLSLYTEWYWTMDLHNLFHFLKLRMDSHAQYEIRVYAEAIYKIIKDIVPLSCEAFEDYILKSITFSRVEKEYLYDLLYDFSIDVKKCENTNMSERELAEFNNKIKAIGLNCP